MLRLGHYAFRFMKVRFSSGETVGMAFDNLGLGRTVCMTFAILSYVSVTLLRLGHYTVRFRKVKCRLGGHVGMTL